MQENNVARELSAPCNVSLMDLAGSPESGKEEKGILNTLLLLHHPSLLPFPKSFPLSAIVAWSSFLCYRHTIPQLPLHNNS